MSLRGAGWAERLEETLDIMARPRLVGQIRDSLAELADAPAEVLTKDQALELRRR